MCLQIPATFTPFFLTVVLSEVTEHVQMGTVLTVLVLTFQFSISCSLGFFPTTPLSFSPELRDAKDVGQTGSTPTHC